jgi:hypothetical protein
MTRATPQTRLAAAVTLLLLAHLLALLAGGCRHGGTHEETWAPGAAPWSPVSRTNSPVARRAVIIGLTRVDHARWGGWSGACPGVDRDIADMAVLCALEGVEAHTLSDRAATRAGVAAAWRAAIDGLRAGDLVVVYYSGHGGVVGDTDGDERDGYDEHWCLWDGPMLDDHLYALLCESPVGLRVALISDSCHSGSMMRRRPMVARVASRRTHGFRGALVSLGACRDLEVAYGAPTGGLWTRALLDAWTRTRSEITWRAWFWSALAVIGTADQTPTWGEMGGPSFADAAALK